MSCPDCPDFVPDSALHLREHIAQEHPEQLECEGHESLAGEHMGETVYCDGTCR